MNVTEKILSLCKEKRIAISKLEKDLGFSNGYVGRLKKGNMPYDRVVAVSEYLGVSLAYLLGDDEPAIIPKKTVKIPILGVVQAGIPIEAQENVLGYEEITEDIAKRGEYFALMVRGDSMQPRMFEGDVVIVRCQPDAENGEIVVAKVNGEDACIKRLKKYGGGIALQSLNSAYPLMTFTEQEISTKPVVILGKAIEIRGKL